MGHKKGILLKYSNGLILKDNIIGSQSKEMLKMREALEEKLRQKGVFSSITAKSARDKDHQQIANGQLETFNDFVDEAMEFDRAGNGRNNGAATHSNKISHQLAFLTGKRKVISGDDDIPNRDDIGERRRRHELRVLARAGIEPVDDDLADETSNTSSDGVDGEGEGEDDSDLEFYKQVEQQHAAKVAAKSNKYSWNPKVPSLPETVDGKRLITNQMEKNRGLTCARKKLIKNPRKKYKLKHQKAEMHRKGQVREVKKPSGPYGGETTGINMAISRSIRFKN